MKEEGAEGHFPAAQGEEEKRSIRHLSTVEGGGEVKQKMPCCGRGGDDSKKIWSFLFAPDYSKFLKIACWQYG